MPFSSGALSFSNTSGNLLSGRTSSWSSPSVSNVSLNSFNRGGTYVPSTGLSPNSSVPTSVGVGNSLSLNTLRGCYRYFSTSFTFTVSSRSYSSGENTYFQYGFQQGVFGTVPSPNTFVTPTGTYSFIGLHHDTGTNYVTVYLSSSSYPNNDDNTFVQVNSTGYAASSYVARSSFTSTLSGANIRYWYTSNFSGYPTSGSSTATFRYYG